MKDFIEVNPVGSAAPALIALSAISVVDSQTIQNARIVTNTRLQSKDLDEVIVTVQNYYQIKHLIEEAQK